MKKLLGPAILLIAIVAATPVSAQSFGELFPVANTRYDTASGTPLLAANGREFFLFWSGNSKIRATSVAQQDRPRIGHVVLNTSAEFDVAWNGEVFLVASSRPLFSGSTTRKIIGRVLDAEARPLGDELALAEQGTNPQLAGGPESMVMVYRTTSDYQLRVLVLGPRGERTGAQDWEIETQRDYTGYAVAGNDDGFLIALSTTKGFRAIMLDRQGRLVSEQSLPRPTKARRVALATDGSRYFLAWAGDDEVAATTIDRDGSFGTPRFIETTGVGMPSAAWTGTGWSVSYQFPRSYSESYARVVQLDSSAQKIIASEQSAVAAANPSVAAVNGRIMAAWNPYRGAASVVELPLAANVPRLATYSATQQTLLATASSAAATLIVWREQSEKESSVRSGLRTHDGRWTERELTTDSDAAVAASDGNRFVVIVRKGSGQELIRLDEYGRPLAPPERFPGSRAAIAWNGSHYAIITGGEAVALQGRLLSPTGVWSAPVTIPRDTSGDFFDRIYLASNGDGFLLAGETLDCLAGYCDKQGLKAMRLGAGLLRTDAEEIVLDDDEDDYGLLAGAVWNGSEYVVVWPSYDGFVTGRMPASAGASATVTRTRIPIFARGVASMPDGTIVVAGNSGGLNALQAAFLRNDGSFTSFDFDSSSVVGRPSLTTLPDGIAVVASRVEESAPHHGTSHVMMAIARPSVTPPPYPPYVHARLQDGLIVVDWSASAGTLNGYRLEYRVDDGSWNELEEWFPPNATHKVIRPPFGTHYDVRMRALNDGGASAYSAVATTKPVRRRAAR